MNRNNPIDLFLADFTNENTIIAYRSFLNKYFETIGKKSTNYFTDTKTLKDYETDIKVFWNDIKTRSPPSRNLRLNVVKNLFEDNNININKSFFKKLRRRVKGTKPQTQKHIPTKKEMKKLFLHTDVFSKALFLFSLSSGMRIEEILQLEPNDIDMSSEPVKINIRGKIAKNGNPRITFITNEAKNSLEAWLKERNNYIKRALWKTKNFSHYELNPNDNRIFPMQYNKPRDTFINILKKENMYKIDNNTNRTLTGIHELRGYFKTNLEHNGMPTAIIEQLMGHDGYCPNYRQFTEEQLKKHYTDNATALIINSSEEQLKEVEKLKKELEDFKQIIKAIGIIKTKKGDIYQREDRIDDNVFFPVLTKTKNAKPLYIDKNGNEFELISKN